MTGIMSAYIQQRGRDMAIVLEMEDLNIVQGFKLEKNGAASGRTVLQGDKDQLSVATYKFTEKSGLYELDLGYFDENDGKSSLKILVNNTVVDNMILDKNLGSSNAGSDTLVHKILKIELSKGDVISFEGQRDNKEGLRLDKMSLNRVGDLTKEPDPIVSDSDKIIRIEAESMSSNGFVEKSVGFASNDKYMQAKTKTASLTTKFSGPEGSHDLVLNYFDEADGASKMSLKVDGKIVETWIWDKDLGSDLANSKTLTTKTFKDVDLHEGSKIELIGSKHGSEPMRVDSLEIMVKASSPEPKPEPQPDPVLDPVIDTDKPKNDDSPSAPPPSNTSELKAFAGAEGFGQDSVGGRGGDIIHVTNLKNSGKGSLRWALEDVSGPRTVVFDVEGKITLNDEIKITDPYVTIAGQTAPGDGVVLTGARIKIETHDVIMRGMKIRPGDDASGDTGENRDALSVGNGAENVIVDHNSFTWAVDETVAIWGQTKNITISNNIIGESLYDSIHWKGAHAMGLIVGNKPGEPNSENITIAKNLFVSNNGRNPLIKQTFETELVNNYVTNYGLGHNALNLSGDSSGAPSEVAVKGNYYEDGKDTGSGSGKPPFNLKSLHEGSKIFMDDNFVEGHNDNQVYGKTNMIVNKESFASSNVNVLDAKDVKSYVLDNVGARVDGKLDVVDSRIIQQTQSGTTRIIDSQDEVGGLKGYKFDGDQVKDSDGDGMADWFENEFAEYGFNVNKADNNKDYDGDGYTNIEEYVNGLITGFDFGPQGGIYGTSGTDSFKLPSNATKTVHLHGFERNKDFLDIGDVLSRNPNDIDEVITDFVKTSYDKSSSQVSVYIDADGKGNSFSMKLTAVIENADQPDMIDAFNILF